MNKVGLIGLNNHSFQVDDGKVADENIQKFRDLVRNACKTFQAQAIAEEISEERVNERGKKESVCLQEASSLGISHRYCDPDNGKRKELGIRDFADIQQELWIACGDEDPPAGILDAQYRKEQDKRERCWLEELQSLNVSSVVFVCGAYHVESFRRLLEGAGFNCVPIIYRWPSD